MADTLYDHTLDALTRELDRRKNNFWRGFVSGALVMLWVNVLINGVVSWVR